MFDQLFQDMVQDDTRDEVGNFPDDGSFELIHLFGGETVAAVREFSYVV